MFPRIRLDFIPVQARVGSVPLGIHHIIYLFIVFVFTVAIIPKFDVSRPQVSLIIVWIVLCLSIVGSGYPQPDLRTVLSHLAVVAVATAISIIIQTSKDVQIIHIIYSAYISGSLVSMWDITVFVTPLEVGETTGSLIPFISRGGIGLPVSSGTHGIVVGMGFVAGLYLLQQLKNKSSLQRVVLLMTVFSMLISILISGSRSSLMALLIGATVFYSYNLLVLGRKAFLLLSASLTTGLVAVGYTLASLRFKTVFQRLNQNRAAIDLALDHPLTGVGWQEVFPVYLDKVIHNTPLNYFAASGIPTGFMFILTMAYPAFTGVRMLLSGNGDQRTILTMLSLWQS